MTTDRDLIARIIHDADSETREDWETVTANPEFFDLTIESRYAQADAILAAIGDRLMPEFPEWVGSVDVILAEPGVGQDRDLRYLFGTGPTISAAVRDALENVE